MVENNPKYALDFFFFLKGELIEMLECLANGEPWRNYIMGFELPEHDDTGSFEEGVMIFMNTSTYNELHLDSITFYNHLQGVCGEYIIENPKDEMKIQEFMGKIKTILKI